MKNLSWTFLVSAVLCLTGCGYRFGNHPPAGLRTVSVGKVNVDEVKGEPRMALWTAEKVRNAIAMDNSHAHSCSLAGFFGRVERLEHL